MDGVTAVNTQKKMRGIFSSLLDLMTSSNKASERWLSLSRSYIEVSNFSLSFFGRGEGHILLQTLDRISSSSFCVWQQFEFQGHFRLVLVLFHVPITDGPNAMLTTHRRICSYKYCRGLTFTMARPDCFRGGHFFLKIKSLLAHSTPINLSETSYNTANKANCNQTWLYMSLNIFLTLI